MAVRQPIHSEVQPFFEVVSRPYSRHSSLYARAGKRAFDIVVSLLLLILFTPVILALMLLVAVSSGFPVFYTGIRMGQDGRRFRIFKLRTMVPNAEAIIDLWRQKGTQEGVLYVQSYKLHHDPRVTPVGRFLRKTSLDELPQLLNVLRGDMSLVGPRPVVEEELEKYGEDQDILLSVKPGLTGLWQVSGRNDVDYPERADLELEYAGNLSWKRDMMVIARTIPLMLFKQNGR